MNRETDAARQAVLDEHAEVRLALKNEYDRVSRLFTENAALQAEVERLKNK